ncbi:tRNA dihydrouridine synthase DusB [Oceanicoccus sp. KOV_DT_Chl]|uniref:tRNA dihydrouridine synthase DusB n=1 Tax=Oceanicoccus sp. KOV_DT_Chl TaxID=1904639 RepID=UPI000C79C5F1|nr:tRNA dihydrouridine synthase DusB [Oceanicoccus sp. KOV_DT_Chl]
MFQIGPYSLASRVVLAPMAGVTDLPFRQLCRRFGAGLVVSEMVTSDSRLWHTRKSQQRLTHCDELEPRSVQIAGGDAVMMAAAARLNVERGAQIIDINMGCPAKKVCKKAAGSALMKDQKLVAEILHAVVAAVDVPVTLKIRTGWSTEQRNGLDIARIAEDCGIAALAVHGRTKACRFNGQAEYDTIAAIKAAIAIPVFANGDIDSPQKAKQVMDYTNADAVMIGRAAQGRPWLCREIDHFLASGELLASPGKEEIKRVLLQHLDALHTFYGEFMGVKIARKHVGWYLTDGVTDNQAFRKKFNQIEDAIEQCLAIDWYFEQQSAELFNHQPFQYEQGTRQSKADTASNQEVIAA